jgi:glycerol-3-phosphate dehydrogenase
MRYDVVIFGGGATGTATFRDLSMRGFSVALIEKRTIASGTTSSSHQNLLGGMRYVLKDPIVAQECAKENEIVSNIASEVVGDVLNYFVGVTSEYALSALQAAKTLHVQAKEVDIDEVFKEIPELNRNLNVAVETADKNINAERFCWLNCHSAKQNGGSLFENSELRSIHEIEDEFVISTSLGNLKTNYIINATGPWVNTVASKVNTIIPLTYSQGTIIVQKALCSRGIQHLREPSDADAYIVHDGHGWLGTTSTTIQRPEDANPEPWADTYLKNEFARILPNVKQQPTLRMFTGVRALADGDHAMVETGGHFANGRLKSRDFKVIEDPTNVFHVIGGKLTTARLMAEKIVDAVCQKAPCNAPCRTSKESLNVD